MSRVTSIETEEALFRAEEAERARDRALDAMLEAERVADEARADLAALAPAWHVAAVGDNPATLRAAADVLERGAREGADAALAVRKCIAAAILPAETLALLGQARLGRSIHAVHARNLRERADALERPAPAGEACPVCGDVCHPGDTFCCGCAESPGWRAGCRAHDPDGADALETSATAPALDPRHGIEASAAEGRR